ncbi:hypothetical protein V3C99_011176 [Haemonchus contortus]|uniref:Protein ZK1290.13 n=1 Tax=Haemonchus contortus TaxID=6289 RepID=W6NAG4_HAECO
MKTCGISLKAASQCMVVFESIITKLLLIISICSVIYSPTWLPVFINFAFLLFALFSMTCYSFCWKRSNNICVLPILVYETVSIFWIMIWLYASITAISTGYLWSLEWIGGPQTDRTPTSHDILDERYVNPNETNPETQKAIKYGSIILVISFVVLILKVFAWTIARRVFKELRKEREISTDKTKAHSTGPIKEKMASPVLMMELSPMLDAAQPAQTPSPRESYI